MTDPTPALTADEFEQAYATRSGLTVEQLRALGRVVRPCNCGDDSCQGWQSMTPERAALYDEALAKGEPTWLI
jgi:hypothetical protein